MGVKLVLAFLIIRHHKATLPNCPVRSRSFGNLLPKPREIYVAGYGAIALSGLQTMVR